MLLQFKCLLQEGDGIVKSFKKVRAEVFRLHKMMRIKNSMRKIQTISRIGDLRITLAPPAPLRGQSSAELNRGLSSIFLAKYTYLLAKRSTKVCGPCISRALLYPSRGATWPCILGWCHGCYPRSSYLTLSRSPVPHIFITTSSLQHVRAPLHWLAIWLWILCNLNGTFFDCRYHSYSSDVGRIGMRANYPRSPDRCWCSLRPKVRLDIES